VHGLATTSTLATHSFQQNYCWSFLFPMTAVAPCARADPVPKVIGACGGAAQKNKIGRYSVSLAMTAAAPCTGAHPVVVLVVARGGAGSAAGAAAAAAAAVDDPAGCGGENPKTLRRMSTTARRRRRRRSSHVAAHWCPCQQTLGSVGHLSPCVRLCHVRCVA